MFLFLWFVFHPDTLTKNFRKILKTEKTIFETTDQRPTTDQRHSSVRFFDKDNGYFEPEPVA